MRTRALRWAAIVMGLCAALPATAAEPEKITLAIPAFSFSFTMQYVAQDLGFFEKEGLAVQELDIAGLGAINSLIAGSTDFTLASGASLTRAAAKGQRLLDIAALSDRPFAQIVMRKDAAEKAGFDAKAPLAQRAQVLRGHTIAVDAVNTVNHAYLRVIARAGGYDPESLKIAVMAATSMSAAFATKQIDGFVMTPPWPEKVLVEGSAVLIASGPDGDPENLSPMINSVLLTRPEMCEKREAVCAKMGRAYAQAAAVIRNAPDKALAVLKKRFTTLDDKTIAASFDVLRKITPSPPAPTLDGIRNNETYNVMAGLLKPEEALKSFDGLFTDKYVR